MADVRMWTSKLGNKFPFDKIQTADASSQKELKRLRSLPENSCCADCGCKDNSWASVTHGVFVCIVCSDVHRAVGTHITKMKGCTGTYLWGPDELEVMGNMGNRKAAMIYGSKIISSQVSKQEKQQYVVDKYDRKLFANKTAPQAPISVAASLGGVKAPSHTSDSLLLQPPLLFHVPQVKLNRPRKSQRLVQFPTLSLMNCLATLTATSQQSQSR